MTKPDILSKMRTIVGVSAASLIASSFAAAYFATNYDPHPLDYWLMWFSGLGLVFSIIGGIVALVLHGAYLDQCRSN